MFETNVGDNIVGVIYDNIVMCCVFIAKKALLFLHILIISHSSSAKNRGFKPSHAPTGALLVAILIFLPYHKTLSTLDSWLSHIPGMATFFRHELANSNYISHNMVYYMDYLLHIYTYCKK